jgi:hypothetical protein
VVCPEHGWWAGYLDNLKLATLGISGGLQDLNVAGRALVLEAFRKQQVVAGSMG